MSLAEKAIVLIESTENPIARPTLVGHSLDAGSDLSALRPTCNLDPCAKEL